MERLDDSLKDISEIRSMMERSSKFLSLSGLSGVSAGCVALAGAAVAQWYNLRVLGEFQLHGLEEARNAGVQTFFVIDAGIVFVVALGLAILFSTRMARRKGLPVWDGVAKQMIGDLSVPLLAGGMLCLIFMAHDLFALLPALSLVFYGVGLVSTSKYTRKEIRLLGFAEIFLGLCAALSVRQGLLLWAAGFGVLHIAYGLLMYRKYER